MSNPGPIKRHTFISELRVQIEMIDDAILEITNRGFEDVWGKHVRVEDRTQYAKLQARRKEIRAKIIDAEN